MASDPLLDHLRRHGTALVDDARAALGRPVEACPGWDVGRLLVHLGRVYRWAAVVARTGERQPGGADPEVADQPAWCAKGLVELLEVLEAEDPDRPAWTFASSGDQRVGWWTRRQAVETAVHHWDVLASAGRGDPAALIDAELGAAGIEEYLADFLPRLLRRPVAGLEGTLHLHCTDIDGEWVVDLDRPSVGPERRHAKADTALRGPASSLLLWLWNRVEPAHGAVEAFGRSSVLGCWPQLSV